jgi:hypothetical protein
MPRIVSVCDNTAVTPLIPAQAPRWGETDIAWGIERPGDSMSLGCSKVRGADW